MNTIKQWRNDAVSLVEAHEAAITMLLIVIALILIAVACFGKPSHKAAAMLYIVL